MDELNKSFPQDTLIQSAWLPTIRAQVALNRHDATGAIDLLGAAAPYDLSASSAYPVCPDIPVLHAARSEFAALLKGS